jgi:trans-aconitate methyltransferase
MSADFAGETARLYARYRRDLPRDQTRELVERLGLRADDIAVDLGCGTGQLTVPLRVHCTAVIGLDPEPAMLAGLRARHVPGVHCLLAAAGDLPELGRLLAGRTAEPAVGAVVTGNALHLMDEVTVLAEAADLLRPEGALGVITQGPPLWLGTSAWQLRLRQVVEGFFGPATRSCGSDLATLKSRAQAMRSLGLSVETATWTASYVVTVEWVLGHLGSALPAGALRAGEPGGPAAAVRAALEELSEQTLEEDVTTTALIARRAG